MARVVALILHRPAAAHAGPLEMAFDTILRANAQRHRDGFAAAGAEVRFDDTAGDETFGGRVRRAIRETKAGGLVVLGSGALPLTNAADWRTFVDAADGPDGRALANSRFSADVIAIAGAAGLAVLPGLDEIATDNALPRWLGEHGAAVDDLHGRWRLQLDLDSPFDALLVRPDRVAPALEHAGIETGPVRAALMRATTVARDASRELVVAGRASAAGLAWLERSTASRTRALIEERGFRTRAAGQRPVRSALGVVLDRDGPAAFGDRLAELGDAALVDSRVLLAHHFGADERAWPRAEDRFASDFLLPDRITDPWLRALTQAARDAPIPVVLGGHTLVGPGLRLALRTPDAWT